MEKTISRFNFLVFLIVAALFIFPAISFGEEDPHLYDYQPSARQNDGTENGPDLTAPIQKGFGTTDGIDLWIPAMDFHGLFGGTLTYNSWYYWTGPGSFAAMIPLPHGAHISGYRVFYSDSTANNISVDLQKVLDDASGVETPTWTSVSSFTSTGTPGRTSTWVAFDHTVNLRQGAGSAPAGNAADFYAFVVGLPNDSGVDFKGIRVFWNRQISPAPGGATFNDVGTGHWAHQFIEALAASGITTGCGGNNFCPNSTVSRAQMAAFIARALGLHWSPFVEIP